MKKVTIRSLMILSLALVMAACGSTTKTFKIPSTVKNDAYGLTGRAARYVYNGLTGTAIKNLNYMETAEQANAQYFANFVDGLLTHNEYGVLEKNLAEKVTHNDDFTEFTFTVRDGVKWQTYDGAQYVATVNGVATPQFVTAEDWFTTVKQVCTFANGSDLFYLITNFVRGTADYLAYTYVLQTKIKEGTYGPTDYKKIAKDMNNFLKDPQNSCSIPWALEHGNGDNPVTQEDVAAIASGSKIGVTFDNEKRTVTYSLFQKASYFPTLFTYSTYLPTNKYFIGDKSIGFANFGNAADKILYNGPYLLKTSTETEIKMVANPDYFNKENTIVVGEVNYKVLTSAVKDSYTRQEFEAGRIDGFSISYKDGEGWKKYIEGKDGKGTYEDPASEYVNARLTETIGNCYNTNINMDRVASGQATSYSSFTTADDVANTARALSIDDVRQAIINSPDWEVFYDENYSDLYPDFRQQYKTWSYVPRNFVLDDDGNDYVEHHFFQEILEHNPEKFSSLDEVIETYKNGDVSAENLTNDEVRALALKAKAAIEKYNETAATKITFPVKIEMYATGDADTEGDTKEHETNIINNINMRLNGLASPEDASAANCQDFYVVPTDQIEDSTTADTASHGGNFDFAPVLWGWGADYGDPLTYMNTYVHGGDWASIFAFIGQEEVKSYRSNRNAAGEITGLEEYNLLEEYGDIVAAGGAETDDINKRFDYFAEAEYKLIYELGIIKPQVNYGQGWSLSVSRSAGYQVPTANYGIASERFVGLYVLDKVMSRTDRKNARAKQDEMKAAYLEEVGGVINIYDE